MVAGFMNCQAPVSAPTKFSKWVFCPIVVKDIGFESEDLTRRSSASRACVCSVIKAAAQRLLPHTVQPGASELFACLLQYSKGSCRQSS